MSSSTPADGASTSARDAGHDQQLRQDAISHELILSYEQMAEDSGIPLYTWQKNTDPRFWDRTVDIGQPLDRQHVNTYIGQLVAEYQGISTLQLLVQAYREDFQGWTTYQFGSATRPFKRAILRRLLQRGYLLPNDLTLNEQLVHPLRI